MRTFSFLLLLVFSLVLFSAPVNGQTCTTPADQNFGNYTDLSYGSSITYKCISYTGSNPTMGVSVGIGNALENAITSSPIFSESAIVIYSNGNGGGYAQFGTDNGYNFGLKSFVAEFFGHNGGEISEIYNIVGYRDGNEIVRVNNFNVTASGTTGSGNSAITWNRNSYNGDIYNNSGILTFGSGWGNIDMVRLFAADAAPYTYFYVALDNLDFEPAIALPATFGNITARIKNKNLLVKWQTLSETNNDHFTIEVSANGETFKEIGTLKSAATNGNANGINNYTFQLPINDTGLTTILGVGMFAGLLLIVKRNRLWFAVIAFTTIAIGISCNKVELTDVDTNGKLYIRIAQIDKDHSKTYSKVITVEEE